MSGLLAGKTAVISGIANKWSLAFAIAESFSREGAELVLTAPTEKLREGIEAITSHLKVAKTLVLDVTSDQDLEKFGEDLKALGRPIDALVHSLAFANRMIWRIRLCRPGAMDFCWRRM
jgi:enoyl-[acyl-carrier protein] reductase I